MTTTTEDNTTLSHSHSNVNYNTSTVDRNTHSHTTDERGTTHEGEREGRGVEARPRLGQHVVGLRRLHREQVAATSQLEHEVEVGSVLKRAEEPGDEGMVHRLKRFLLEEAAFREHQLHRHALAQLLQRVLLARSHICRAPDRRVATSAQQLILAQVLGIGRLGGPVAVPVPVDVPMIWAGAPDLGKDKKRRDINI